MGMKQLVDFFPMDVPDPHAVSKLLVSYVVGVPRTLKPGLIKNPALTP